MSNFNEPKRQEKLQSYLNIHLKKDELSLPDSQKIEALEKKKRNKWIQLVVNIAAILFFSYSFFYNITQLSGTFFYIIFAVFVVNVGLIFYQKNQINELIAYLGWKDRHEH